MSTSSRSTRRDRLRPARRHWATGIAASVALALTIIWAGAGRASTTELRLAATGDTVTAQLVDGPHVILFANAEKPAEARAALGVLSRPWEARPSVVVADARERVAAGLWETLQRHEPAQLIVLGAPGDSDAWHAIERHCRAEGIEIRYLETTVRLELETLALTLVPAPDGSHAIISSSELRIALALGGLPESGRHHALIGSDDVATTADLWIHPEDDRGESSARTHLEIQDGRRVTLVLGDGALRVRGGRLIGADAD